ncbi:hypothetical protein COT20_01735 [bacterium (Candidatus Gribaldobacteria) CG08_land_8_20_14_0_20_39_15]|uniref:Uncharacterized protein n=1 Tax=bacterium (Candidatus Gribaldobacteria) CG08_land_8_20_14_0_20_39_15 TaxID=2014273 RepID=A0A2M6XUL4_9BACT|nr:MAG: hypothetical protein COT20_01735 [bacterium (Candidatus Gribaldobacteria) CG08_land_8_20_14_0_20_39_15]
MNKENKLPSQVNNLLLGLNEEQLKELNYKVVERLKLIHRAKSVMSMAKFNLLDRVYFIHSGEKKISTVIRLNPRSVTVRLDNGHEWRIAPEFLTKI